MANKKRRVEKLTTEHDSADCASADAFLDLDYPVDLLVENFLRMLNYESVTGVAELLGTAIRCAGAHAQFTLPAMESDNGDRALSDDVARDLGAEIDASCLANTHPASFPAKQKKVATRLAEVMARVAEAMRDAGSQPVLETCIRCITALASAKLQSLRFVSTLILASIADLDEEYMPSLESRATDVNVGIRKLAVAHLPASSVAAHRALNDDNAGVRTAAVRCVRGNSTGNVSKRVYEMAMRDVDLTVRRAALRAVIEGNIEGSASDMAKMLFDEDELSRNLAGEILARNHEGSDDLMKLARFIPEGNVEAAAAIAVGLKRAQPQLDSDVCVSIFTKRRKRALDLPTQRALLLLLAPLLANNSAVVVPQVTALIRAVAYSDELLALAFAAAANLHFEGLVAKSAESERYVSDLLELVCQLFLDRSSVAPAAGKVFTALSESLRQRILPNLYQDLRIQLATQLGSLGKPSNIDAMHAVVRQLMVLAQFVDITDLANLPIWNSVEAGDATMLNLARAIALKGDTAVMQLVVKKLVQRAMGPAVDDLLRIYIAAKMRDIELGTFPCDINTHESQSNSVWRAAVAARVI